MARVSCERGSIDAVYYQANYLRSLIIVENEGLDSFILKKHVLAPLTSIAEEHERVLENCYPSNRANSSFTTR